MAKETLKAYNSSIKAIRVIGGEGQIQFNEGYFQTDDVAIQKMIESTPSFIDGVITEAESRAENDTAVLAAKKAEAKAEAEALKNLSKNDAAPKAAPAPAAAPAPDADKK